MVVSQVTLFSRTKIFMVTNAISVCTENGFGENRDTLSQAIKAMISSGIKIIV